MFAFMPPTADAHLFIASVITTLLKLILISLRCLCCELLLVMVPEGMVAELSQVFVLFFVVCAFFCFCLCRLDFQGLGIGSGLWFVSGRDRLQLRDSGLWDVHDSWPPERVDMGAAHASRSLQSFAVVASDRLCGDHIDGTPLGASSGNTCGGCIHWRRTGCRSLQRSIERFGRPVSDSDFRRR